MKQMIAGVVLMATVFGAQAADAPKRPIAHEDVWLMKRVGTPALSPDGRWVVLDSVASTQSVAAALLAEGNAPHVVFAHDQVAGRGRFDRSWQSRHGSSLTFSILWPDLVGHPEPWLLGMACGVAVAEVVGCSVRWPNDMAFEGLKVGGILTELLPDAKGRRVPVAGIGVNLADGSFPEELRSTATHLEAHGQSWSALDLAQVAHRRAEVPLLVGEAERQVLIVHGASRSLMSGRTSAAKRSNCSPRRS